MPKKERTRLLGAPDVDLPVPGLLASYCYAIFPVALAGLGALGSFFTAFGVPLRWPVVFWVGAACVLLCCAQSLMDARLERKWKAAVPILLLLIWGILLYRNFSQAAQGLFHTVNLMLESYGKHLRLNLPRLTVSAATERNPAAAVTTFACLFEFPFFWILSALFVRFHSYSAIFAWTGIFLLAPLALSILPASWALAAMILFWAFLMLCIPAMGRGRTGTSRSGKKVKISGESYARPITLLLLPLFALCMAVIYRAFPPEELVRPAFIDELRTQLTEGVNLPAIFKGGTGSGNNRVDLSSIGKRDSSDQTALKVRYRWVGGIKTDPDMKKNYLKSFVGSEYTGNSWEQLPPGKWKEAETLLGDKHAQELAAGFHVQMPIPDETAVAYQMTVEKVNVDSRAIYSPYGLWESESLPDGVGYAADGFLRASRWLSWPREYTLEAVNLPQSSPVNARVLSSMLALAEDVEADGAVIRNMDGEVIEPDSYDPAEAVVLNARRKGNFWLLEGEDAKAMRQAIDDYNTTVRDGGLTLADRMPVAQSTRKFYDGGGLGVANAAERYTNFVYENYLQLPDETRDFALNFLKEMHFVAPYGTINPDRVTREELAAQLRELLSNVCEYDLSPPKLPEGRDFTEFFLTESKEGFCVHFATAGVVLLRAMGVPARYAEGYVTTVPEENALVRVENRNAHAWVEVYYSGTGWIPVEMTPQNEDAPATYEDALLPHPEVEPTPTPTPPPEPTDRFDIPIDIPEEIATPSPTPDMTVRPRPNAPAEKVERKPLPAPLLYLMFALLLLFLLWLSRILRIAVRRRTFRQRNRNKAALCVYRHLLRLYRESFLLPFGKADPPEEVTQLAMKARFSSHVITKEELQDLLDRAATLEERLNLGLARRLRLKRKYLRALF